jgi:hypothetical protein
MVRWPNGMVHYCCLPSTDSNQREVSTQLADTVPKAHDEQPGP